MDKLEHKIKQAFIKRDGQTSFSSKDNMWDRLDSELHGRKGVAAFWRIAAVFLGLLLTLGVVASLNNRAKQRVEIENTNQEIKRLHTLVDSLLTIPAEVKTEVQIVEKERVVYRDRVVEKNISTPTDQWRMKYQKTIDSLQVLQNQNTGLKTKIEVLNDELLALKSQVANASKLPSSEQTNPFELKSDRVELGIQKKPSAKSPELEMKVFQKNFIENRNNLNSTIFKK